MMNEMVEASDDDADEKDEEADGNSDVHHH